MSTATITDAELEALASRIATLEHERASRPPVGLPEFTASLGEAQTRRWLERRERARLQAEAKSLARAATDRERRTLEGRLAAVREDRGRRRTQHARAGRRIEVEYAEAERVVLAALEELRVRTEQMAAEALRGRTVEVAGRQMPRAA